VSAIGTRGGRAFKLPPRPHCAPIAMSYLLLIHEPIGQRAERGEADGRIAYDRMLTWGATLKEQGLLIASESLKSQDEQAAKLQVRNGKTHVLDGPFAEAKEMIGGFFLLSCSTRAEALAIAAQCQAAEWATVEVREIAPCYV
jgi:hypothetical protein